MKRSEMEMLVKEVIYRSMLDGQDLSKDGQQNTVKWTVENLLDTLEENGMIPPGTEECCENPDGDWEDYTVNEWEPEDEQ